MSARPTRLPHGVFSSGNSTGNANYGTWWFWLGLILLVGILLLVGNLERSRVGRAWVAIREDEDAAEVMGVNTFRFKLWAFVIGAGHRRIVRGALRWASPVRRPADVQHHQLDAVPHRRRARRAGQQARRDPRRVHHRLSTQPAARRGVVGHQPRRLEVSVLRARPGGDDDLPPAGPVPGPPAIARIRQVSAPVAGAAPDGAGRPHDRTRDRRGDGGADSRRERRRGRDAPAGNRPHGDASAGSPHWTR